MSTKRNTTKTKKKSSFGRFIYTIILVAILIFAIISIFIARYILLINKTETQERNTNITSVSILNSSKVKNILLIGTDGRDTSDRGRSDSMILVSINSETKEIYLTSFMRDMYVAIPSYDNDKLNASYAYGGAELLMDTIQQNFKIKIDDYMLVNFNSFAKLVDAVGGVEITLSDRESEAINAILHDEVNGLMGDPIDADYLSGGGTFLLNGKQALSYSRIRYVGDADFERTQRQRTVINGMIEQAKGLNPITLDKCLKIALPELTTNIGDLDLYFTALRVPSFAFGYSIVQQRIPADSTWSYDTMGGASVLQVDFNANTDYLKQTVYKGTD